MILDEVTNNLDIESRAHVIQVLKAYPGALFVISHDEDFLTEIAMHDYYHVLQGKLQRINFSTNDKGVKSAPHQLPTNIKKRLRMI